MSETDRRHAHDVPRRTYERRRRPAGQAQRDHPARSTRRHSSRASAGPTRFDLTVVATLVLLLMATALVAWRGDQVGIRVVETSPADGATHVSTQIDVRITLDRPIDDSPASHVSIDPPIDVRVRREGNTLVVSPEEAFRPETTYRITLAEGLTGPHGRSLLESVSWQFTTGRPRIVYVAADEGGRQQLYAVNPDGGEQIQLTTEEIGVWGEFAVSPDGRRVAYAAQRPDGGNDLWSLDLQTGERWPLLQCDDADCAAPAWTPDGMRIVYERRTINPAGVPRLWWLVVESGETAPVFQDSQQIGLRPTLSPDGRWLSYVSPDEEGVRVLHLEDGRSTFIPSQMGEPAEWSPTSDAVLVTAIQELDDGYFLHILKANLASEAIVDLSSDQKVDDRTPRWSPDGMWIAFWRRHIPTSDADPSDELWIMRPDGREARSVYVDPDVQHSPPEWSPDSQFVVFERYPLTAASPQSELWLVNVETGDAREPITPGTRPAWAP